MQFNLPIDIAEGFDRLSIMEVKKSKSPPLKQAEIELQIQTLQNQISTAIGLDLAEKIYDSPEYKELYNVNKEIFLSIDELRLESKCNCIDYRAVAILGIKIDSLNTKRFNVKNKIQEKHFGKKMEEVKL